jgi:hypothetical protein
VHLLHYYFILSNHRHIVRQSRDVQWKFRNPPPQALEPVPHLLTLQPPPSADPTRKHQEATGICPEITLDVGYAESSAIIPNPPRHAFSQIRHPPTLCSRNGIAPNPTLGDCPMWANVSIASASEPGIRGQERWDWSRRGRCGRVVLAWGAEYLFPRTRWAGCHE